VLPGFNPHKHRFIHVFRRRYMHEIDDDVYAPGWEQAMRVSFKHYCRTGYVLDFR